MNSIVTFEREDVGENGVGRRRCDGDKDDDDDEDVVVVHVVIVVVTLGRDLRLSSCLRVCLRETRREDVKENGVKGMKMVAGVRSSGLWRLKGGSRVVNFEYHMSSFQGRVMLIITTNFVFAGGDDRGPGPVLIG